MRIYKSMTELIGRTPLVQLSKYERLHNIDARMYAKLEAFNPAGSAKDRVALSMIEAAEKSGKLQPGGTIVEPTSGNTGIGIAAVGAALGYKVIIVMPENMSEERKKLIRAYGAELVLTPAEADIPGAIKKAKEIAETTPGAVLAGQFENEANPDAHRNGTGPEIWEDTMGTVDILVAGIGTGGTITGIGEYLKALKPSIQVVAVEPIEAPILTADKAGKDIHDVESKPHGIQGIGDGLIPDVLNTKVYDEIITVSTEDAIATAKEVILNEGLLVGFSSGATLYAARELAKRPENKGKRIVSMFMDSGDRYLSLY